MIFVTVGTHEQPFNRLIKQIDELKENGSIKDTVMIQTGFSTYVPQKCGYSKFMPHDEINDLVNKARIVITHGGPSSFIMPLQVGKVPIVVPRLKEFGEHVNSHQLEFANAVANRRKNIIVVEKIELLGQTILDYDNIVNDMNVKVVNNNKKFNADFSNIVDSLF